MDHCGKKSKGWHVAGLILAVILFLITSSVFALGYGAFGTAEYPIFGETAFYPAEDNGILPEGAAAVVDCAGDPVRGVPAAYYDTEAERIRIKYYYGEAEGKIVLTNEQSEDAVEILPEQLRGCVQSYIPLLGYFLRWACSLGGVCINLAISILLLVAAVWIATGFVKALKKNRRIDFPGEDALYLAESEEEIVEEIPEEAAEEVPLVPCCIGGCEMELIGEGLSEGYCGRIFRGEATDVLKLSKIFRTAAEKRGVASVTVEEQYGEVCELKVTCLQEDESFTESSVNMLKEREESQ